MVWPPGWFQGPLLPALWMIWLAPPMPVTLKILHQLLASMTPGTASIKSPSTVPSVVLTKKLAAVRGWLVTTRDGTEYDSLALPITSRLSGAPAAPSVMTTGARVKA